MNLFRGRVTHVIDPSSFWMRIGTESDMKLFSEYQQSLDFFYNEDRGKYLCSIDHLYPGYLVVALQPRADGDYPQALSDDIHWERAQVTRVDLNSQTVDVFFVDLGYTAIVGVDECRDITVELFGFLSPQASRVSLTGIKPLAREWTTRATSCLQKETLNQDLVTLLVRYNATSGCYAVVIYTRLDDGTWQSLIHEMQNKELALGTSDNIEEYLTDEFVYKSLQRMEEPHDLDHQQQEEDTGTPCNTNQMECDEATMAGPPLEDTDEDWVDGLDKKSTTQKNSSALDSRQTNKASASVSETAVTGFDYRTLIQTRSISVTKMKQEKDWETQEHTKARIVRDLQRQTSEPVHPDEQDWDNVQDVDFHTDIVSQISHFDRQHSDDGLLQILKESMTVDCGPKKSKVKVDGTKQQPPRQKQRETERQESPLEEMNSNGFNEMESYRLEKQIKKILLNEEEKEIDCVRALVYSVVEPDIDTQKDLLCIVISAILEHVIQADDQNCELAFAILETYSDASAFVEAMITVIQELKNRFVWKRNCPRQSGNLKKFASVLAHLFRLAEDWNVEVLKAVHDYIIHVVEIWIIFNKQRKQSGEEIDASEAMYLEAGQVFLLRCLDVLYAKHEASLAQIMAEVRCKLVHNDTPSWIRVDLLDLLLTLYAGQPGTFRPVGTTSSVATQTDHLQGEKLNRDVHPHHHQQHEEEEEEKEEEGQEGLEEQQHQLLSFHQTSLLDDIHVTQPSSIELQNQHSTSNFTSQVTSSDRYWQNASTSDSVDISSLRNRRELPKAIRKLSPRLIKKYLQEQSILAAPQPSSHSSSCITVDNPTSTIITNTRASHTQEKPKSLPNSDIFTTKSSLDSSPAVEVPTVRGNELSSVSNHNDLKPSEPIIITAEPYDVKDSNVSTEPFQTFFPHSSSRSCQSVEKVLDEKYYSYGAPSQAFDKSLIDNCIDSSCIEIENHIDLQNIYSESSTPKKLEENLEVETVETISNDSLEEVDENVSPTLDIENTTIRYTSQELKDLNPYYMPLDLEWWELWEPKEALKKIARGFHGYGTIRNADSLFVKQFGLDWEPKQNPLDNGFPPSVILNTGMSWMKEEEMISSPLKDLGSTASDSWDCDLADDKENSHVHTGSHHQNDVMTEVTQTDVICEKNQNHLSFFSNEESYNGGNLHTIALDLFQKSSVDRENVVDRMEKQKGGEIWHEDSLRPSGDLLKSQKVINTAGLSRKAKKKKGKGTPLDKYLQEQRDKKFDEEGDSRSECGDPFSSEALEMYEELERHGFAMNGGEQEQEEVRVLEPLTLGSHITSSKRPPLFAAVREQQSGQETPKPWCPGRRFCSRCGSSDHVVYNCTEQASRLTY